MAEAENPQQVGQILKQTFDNRCRACEARYSAKESEYCDYCLTIERRKQRLTPGRIEQIVIDLVEPRYANATMDDFDKLSEKHIVDNLRERKIEQDVFVWGKPGVGKTHIFAALIRAYVAAGYECKRSSFSEFCCKIRSTNSPASKQLNGT